MEDKELLEIGRIAREKNSLEDEKEKEEIRGKYHVK
jgi:hypothetical protein